MARELSSEPGGRARGAARRPIVIGLTGPNAAGKGEIAALLVRRGFAYHSLSDIVREEAAARGLTHGREDLIAVGNDLRAQWGPGVLAERTAPRLAGRDVVDSIRSQAEVSVLRRVPGFVLVGVAAPVETRFARARARGRVGDGETLEEFQARERKENSGDVNRQQIQATFELADRVLDNSGSLAALERAVEALVEELERPGALC